MKFIGVLLFITLVQASDRLNTNTRLPARVRHGGQINLRPLPPAPAHTRSNKFKDPPPPPAVIKVDKSKNRYER